MHRGQEEDPQKKAALEAERAEKRRLMLKTLLTPEALERLKRIELVRPESARQIEDTLLMHGARLAGGAQITEEQLINLLEQSSAQTRRGKIQFVRKPDGDDDDSWE